MRQAPHERADERADGTGLRALSTAAPAAAITPPAYQAAPRIGVIENLAVNHHVVALGLRGARRSDAGSGGYSVRQVGAGRHGLIAALELPPVTLVGQSLGTLVVQQAPLDRPKATCSVPSSLEADGIDALVTSKNVGTTDDATRGIREQGHRQPRGR